MSRQHTNPYSIVGDKVFQLQRISDVFDEDWLQRFIFEHHQTIPLGEIEPAFGPLIPVCRELPTKAGPIDLVFINPTGLLTLVECKLWKNPEARREVVGQILDYAKELSRWTYDDLQTAVGQAQSASEASLHRLILANSEYIDERDFVDGVARNLRRGRFLLLIIGDGIRENVEQIATFMDKHAHLNFGYALIEYGVFQMPSTGEPSYFIQPRVIAQTIELERAVFRIEDGQIVLAAPTDDKAVTPGRRSKVSEQVFFERLNADSQAKTQLRELFKKAERMGITIESGQNSMLLKLLVFDVNFGVITVSGDFYNCGIVSTADELGQPQIGEGYLDQLAGLFADGYVSRSKNRFWWTVKKRTGDRKVNLPELLAVEDEWLALIQTTLDKLAQLGEQ